MTAFTRMSGALTGQGKVLGGVLLALFLAAVAVIAVPSVARADTPAPTVEYSSDDGATWGGIDEIDWNLDELVPGRERATNFQVRNASGVEGWVGFSVGQYTLSPGMTATARVDVDGKIGEAVALTEARTVPPGTQLGSIHLEPNATAVISLVVGMPADADNQTQNGHVNPRWAVGFTPDAAPDPGCGGTGSTGSLGCIFGSLGTGSLAS
ncbi:hypothetical protein ERC79_16415 [Rhodococcus sp. ABRD24]|uniref:hypothetical protein n=1 Tax=Rhodococcus sp. ABRD24 TaxID=2507582 RepID=UPI00103EFC16|nr:hypothetical protein [Rhodococcus sp. ABRD24]QBJ97345.1 hypothetical protein ERC79_16415 [Rhodococcus sp. ABRD24]